MIKFFDENGSSIYIYQFNPYGFMDLWKSNVLITPEQIKLVVSKYMDDYRVWEEEAQKFNMNTPPELLEERWSRQPNIEKYYNEIGLTKIEIPYYD